MKRIIFFLLGTIICSSLFAVDNSSAIVYAEDSLSAELKVSSVYFDGEEHYFTFKIPQNKTIKITRINSTYIKNTNNRIVELYVNDLENIITSPVEAFNVGIFVDTIMNASVFTFVIDNFTSDYSAEPKDPAITIRYSVIEEHPTTESIFLNGDVEVVSGALTTSGYLDFMGTKVTAILGDDYNEYTCFGSARGGMIRGSNEGYLILSGNPNGYGSRNVYINRYTSNGNVIMTASSGKVGIGVDYPEEKLHINGAIRGGGEYGQLTLRGDNGSVTIGASDNQMLAFVTDRNNFVFNKSIYNQTGVFSSWNNTNLTLNTNGINRVTILKHNGNMGVGVSNPQYRLDVAGTIRAQEILVNNVSGADFVFEEGYYLRPLSDVKMFIKKNKHLPEIQPAKDMQENGVNMNELQIKLLQKIEELTLYLIQQDQIIQELRKEVELLKK